MRRSATATGGGHAGRWWARGGEEERGNEGEEGNVRPVQQIPGHHMPLHLWRTKTDRSVMGGEFGCGRFAHCLSGLDRPPHPARQRTPPAADPARRADTNLAVPRVVVEKVVVDPAPARQGFGCARWRWWLGVRVRPLRAAAHGRGAEGRRRTGRPHPHFSS